MARNRAVVAILFIAAFAEIFSTSVAIASCPDGFAELGSGNAGDRGQFISPVFGSYGEVILRKLIPVGDERVVVFINYPGLRASSADLEIHLKRQVGEQIKIYRPNELESIENLGSINCHGYACAVSNIPGLPNSWVRGDATEVTEGTNALRAILKTYFRKIDEVEAPLLSEFLTKNGSARDQDFITFIDQNGVFIHSGILIPNPDPNSKGFWVRSKYAANGTFDAPVSAIMKLYPYTRLQIWRRQP